MRANLCNLLLGLGCAFALGGCFLFHEPAGDEEVVVGRDAGPAVDDDGPADGGPVDSDDDAGGACRPATPRLACAPGQRLGLPAGEATSLSISFSDCHCGGMPRCTVSSVHPANEGGAGTVDLRVDICDEGLCRACTGPNEVRCDLPPLEPGTYRITDRGFPLWEMEAGGPLISDPLVSFCQAAASRGGGLCDFPGSDWGDTPLGPPTTTVCFPERVRPGEHAQVTVSGEVSCAAEPGPCDVVQTTTRSAAGTLELRPRLRSCDEGGPTWDCTGASGNLELDCGATMPDHPHERSVLYRGEVLGTIAVTEEAAGATVCVEVTE